MAEDSEKSKDLSGLIETTGVPEPDPSFDQPGEPVVEPHVEVPASEDPLDQIRQYSEKQLSATKQNTPAAFPFSLLIEGMLTPEEQEKLLDLISRENMGFREVDLEPQLASGRILIPRISEYAGILLVQALRSTSAMMRLGPSDSIFSTADTHTTEDEIIMESGAKSKMPHAIDSSHPAESLSVSTDSSVPRLPHFVVIDVVTATAALKTNVVEAEKSPKYQEILEALQREIKYKAYRKGATAIINFSVQLSTLAMPTHYRVMVMGSAVRAKRVGEN